jgi:hypothetical protein
MQSRGSCRLETGWAVDAVGRPVPDWPVAQSILDGGAPAAEVRVKRGGAHTELQAVAIAVERHEVAGRLNLGQQRRPAANLLSDDEEGGPRPGAREGIEHGRRSLGVGAIIEREGHTAGTGERAGDAEPGSGADPDRSESMIEHSRMIPKPGAG